MGHDGIAILPPARVEGGALWSGRPGGREPIPNCREGLPVNPERPARTVRPVDPRVTQESNKEIIKTEYSIQKPIATRRVRVA